MILLFAEYFIGFRLFCLGLIDYEVKIKRRKHRKKNISIVGTMEHSLNAFDFLSHVSPERTK